MAYAEYSFYTSLYGTAASENDFNRLSYDASRLMDDMTSGLDGFRKLQKAFPTEEYDAEAVRVCACKLVKALWDIEQAETAMNTTGGYSAREDGSFVSRIVKSISSGSESITYADGGNAETAVSAAVKSPAAKRALLTDIVKDCLTGIRDANGVNVLYMGVYPYVQQDDNAV